jgi:hypothetical protein
LRVCLPPHASFPTERSTAARRRAARRPRGTGGLPVGSTTAHERASAIGRWEGRARRRAGAVLAAMSGPAGGVGERGGCKVEMELAHSSPASARRRPRGPLSPPLRGRRPRCPPAAGAPATPGRRRRAGVRHRLAGRGSCSGGRARARGRMVGVGG